MSISCIFSLSQPALLSVVGMATTPCSSPAKSARNLRKPCPPVRGDTPLTCACAHVTNSLAPAVEARSMTNLAAFCLVGPCSPANMDESESGMSIGFIRGLLVHESAGRLSSQRRDASGCLQPWPNARLETRGAGHSCQRLCSLA